jgi:hypothetical protein
MRVVCNFALLCVCAWWFGAGVAVIHRGTLPHVHISIDWEI